MAKKFFKSYLEELSTIYKMKYNKKELDEDDIKKIISFFDKKLKPNFRDTKIEIANTCQSEETYQVDMVRRYDECKENDCIFSLSHGVFENKKSQILEIWAEQGVRRNEYKNKMKEELKNNNMVKASTYNGYQKMFKENANALYGVFGESSFTFYDINNISNITGCCVQILLHTINEIEKILGGRVILRNEQEVLDYFRYLYEKDTNAYDILKQEKFPLLEILENKVSDKDSSVTYIYNKLEEYCKFDISEDFKKLILTQLENIFSSDDIGKKIIFTYNCDFKKLVEDTNVFKYIIANDFNNFISNNYSEHLFKEANKMYKIFLEFTVYDDFVQSNLLDIADNYKREIVMLSDTDSTFCHAPFVFNNILECLQEECNQHNVHFDTDLDYKVHAFKMIMFLGETMSDYFLKTIAGENYQNSKNNKWNLKSEYLYNKILFMKIKKTYIGSILSQEGIRLTPMKLDNKNTELVRSKYNFITKDFLKEFFGELIMNNSNNLDISKLLDIRDTFRDKFKIISKNHLECSKLGSRADYKIASVYKNDPFTIYQYKAAVLFNALYPEYKTMPGDKTSLLPIKEFGTFSFEYLVNKELLYSKIVADDDILAKIDKKFKLDNIDIEKFILYVEKEKIEHILGSDFMTTIRLEYLKSKDEEAKKWYINTYGINEDLRDRFTHLFEKEDKSKLEKNLINVLLKDMKINYLAFSYYSSMPESMLDLVDTDKLLISSIDERLVRVFEALDIKVHQRNDFNVITNIIEI